MKRRVPSGIDAASRASGQQATSSDTGATRPVSRFLVQRGSRRRTRLRCTRVMERGLTVSKTWYRSRCGRGAALLFLICLGVSALTAAPPAAQADRGALRIGGVRSGMTQHQVRSILGRPTKTLTRNWSGLREWQWHYPGRLTVGFELFERHVRRVFRVRTRSPKDEFYGEIHVGMKERKLRRRLIEEKCGPQERYEASPRGYACEWGSGGFGCSPRLIFYMRHRHGRVKYIELWGVPRRFLIPNSSRPSLGSIALGCL